MTATVTNFGGNLGVLFPPVLLKNIHFIENENVEMLVKDDNSIIITRIESKKHFTTKERIAMFCGTADDVHSTETDWGTPQGLEIW